MSTFFGNVADSHVRADVDVATASIEHHAGGFTIRNRTVAGNYDRGYQNYVPGAATDDRTRVALTAYNNATARLNVFNQTDVTRIVTSGRIRHTLLAGGEVGRQRSRNFRNTGFFDNAATTIFVPFANPVTDERLTYRQSATDANNRVRTHLGALYAQDQAQLSRFVQIIGGVRFDRFDLQYHNNRNGDTLRRVDHLVSPRTGIVVKTVRDRIHLRQLLALVSAKLRRSILVVDGDHAADEAGAVHQLRSRREVGCDPGAVADHSGMRLDRTNTRATDPADPTRIVQTGSQRTNGYELGINGTLTRVWKIAGGYARQNALVTSATTAARAGAQVGQVPHHTFSLWNNYQLLAKLGAGLGVVRRSDMFASDRRYRDASGYTRADAAVVCVAHRSHARCS